MKKRIAKLISCILFVVMIVIAVAQFQGIGKTICILLGACMIIKAFFNSDSEIVRYVVVLPLILTGYLFIRYLAYGGDYILFIISILLLIAGEVICLLSKGSRASRIFISIWCMAFYVINAIMYVG